MWNGRVIWEKMSTADKSNDAAAPAPALNENVSSGEDSNTFVASPESPPESSQPEFESTSPPNLPSSAQATRTFLKTLWNGGIKNSGSKYSSWHHNSWSEPLITPPMTSQSQISHLIVHLSI